MKKHFVLGAALKSNTFGFYEYLTRAKVIYDFVQLCV
jgi:glutaredoxin-related protein